MKRWLLAAAVIILLILVIALFIPVRKTITQQVELSAASPAVTRYILSNSWNWWPGNKLNDNSEYNHSGFVYHIDEKLMNGFKATIVHQNDSLRGSLVILPVGDSSRFVWSSVISFSKNPVTRIFQNIKLIKFKSNIESLLKGLKLYFDNETNVYGSWVKLIKIDETPLISTEKTFNHYPSVAEIYSLISEVKKFVADNHEKEMNYPMMNVHTEDSVNYNLMVAVQTQREIKSSGVFKLKRLLLGKMLTMDVNGGPVSIQQAQIQLINYLHDHNKVSPAIPYQLLITNRLQENDTAKWKTRLYYPVF